MLAFIFCASSLLTGKLVLHTLTFLFVILLQKQMALKEFAATEFSTGFYAYKF